MNSSVFIYNNDVNMHYSKWQRARWSWIWLYICGLHVAEMFSFVV